MKQIATKLRPAAGFSPVLHRIINALFAVALLAVTQLGFTTIAVALVLLSKWRTISVKPRYWPANIRSNMMDLTVGLSAVVLLNATRDTMWLQIVATLLYSLWLVVLKPMSSNFAIMLQAAVGQLVGITAFYWQFRNASITVMVCVVWLICYSAARHFVTAFEEEPLSRPIAHIWALFGAQLAWILGHWVIFYGVVSQVGFTLALIGYGLGALYYLHKNDKLSPALRLQFILSISLLTVIVIAFSDWQDKTI